MTTPIDVYETIDRTEKTATHDIETRTERRVLEVGFERIREAMRTGDPAKVIDAIHEVENFLTDETLRTARPVLDAARKYLKSQRKTVV